MNLHDFCEQDRDLLLAAYAARTGRNASPPAEALETVLDVLDYELEVSGLTAGRLTLGDARSRIIRINPYLERRSPRTWQAQLNWALAVEVGLIRLYSEALRQGQPRTPEQLQAARFYAASFLVPGAQLRARREWTALQFCRKPDLQAYWREELAEHFQVSVTVMSWVLRALGLSTLRPWGGRGTSAPETFLSAKRKRQLLSA